MGVARALAFLNICRGQVIISLSGEGKGGGGQETREAKIDATGVAGPSLVLENFVDPSWLPKESDVNRFDKKFHGRAILPSKISCDLESRLWSREREREIVAINSRTITSIAGQRHDQHRGCRLLLSFSFKDPGSTFFVGLVFCQKRRYSARYNWTADFFAALHFSPA